MGLHHEALEKEVYQFFSEQCGKIRDVQIIRDPVSGRSKGIAYIEFYLPEGVFKALACTGMVIMGHPVRVQASQAEKNRAAEAAKISTAVYSDVPMRPQLRSHECVFL